MPLRPQVVSLPFLLPSARRVASLPERRFPPAPVRARTVIGPVVPRAVIPVGRVIGGGLFSPRLPPLRTFRRGLVIAPVRGPLVGAANGRICSPFAAHPSPLAGRQRVPSGTTVMRRG